MGGAIYAALNFLAESPLSQMAYRNKDIKIQVNRFLSWGTKMFRDAF
jgi:hypothetical protein